MLALDNPIVDYFSLDVEGSEFPILKSLDWDNVNIQGISYIAKLNSALERILIFNFAYYDILYFSFRKTTLCYVSPCRDFQISLVINVYFFYLLSLFTWKMAGDFKLKFRLFVYNFQKNELNWKVL